LAVSFSELKGLRVKDVGIIGACAFFGISLHIGLLLYGLEQTSAVNAAFLLALSPVVTSILAMMTLSEKINNSHLLGIVAAFVGTFFYLIFPSLTTHTIRFDFTGDFLILASILSGSVYIIGSKKLFETYHPSSIAAVSFVVGMISFFPGAIFEYVNKPYWVDNINFFNIFSILFLGVFSSFIAYQALEWGLSRVAVHVNSTISYLSPMISIIIAIVFLNETVNSIFLLSVFLVMGGVYLVSRHQPQFHLHFHSRTHKV
jgi:drug/metabolite transporter (DMT)-like permease